MASFGWLLLNLEAASSSTSTDAHRHTATMHAAIYLIVAVLSDFLRRLLGHIKREAKSLQIFIPSHTFVQLRISPLISNA